MSDSGGASSPNNNSNNNLNGGHGPRDTRSVSSTLHDRSSARAAVPNSSSSAATLSPNQAHSKRHHHRSASQDTRGNTATPPPQHGAAARDTFLNYFFGGQPGGGPPSASGQAYNGGPSTLLGAPRHHEPVGRDLYPETGASLPSGLATRGVGVDGNAAYDMKSLGKHIEAVGGIFFGFCSKLTAHSSRNRSRQVIIVTFPSAKRWKRRLSGLSSPLTSPSSVNQFKTSSQKLLCTSSSTTRRNTSKTASSPACTNQICLQSCWTRTRRSSASGHE